MLQIVQIKDILNQLLEYIPLDYENYKDDESKTFLYQVLYGTKDGNFDFYEQAKKMFLRTDSPYKGSFCVLPKVVRAFL